MTNERTVTRAGRRPWMPRGIDFATVCVMAGGLALWLAWPGEAALRGGPRSARPASVAYVLLQPGAERLYASPTLFGRSSRAGFCVREEDRDALRPPPYRFASAPCLLNWTADGARTALHSRVETRDDLCSAPPAYRPLWRATPAAPAAPGRAGSPRLALGSGLRDAHFTLSTQGLDALVGTDKSWTATVYVELGEDGRPRHAFLQQYTDDGAIDALLVRTILLHGRARPGPERGGRISVTAFGP